MKLVSFTTAVGQAGIGVVRPDGSVVALATDESLPTTMVDFVALGAAGLDAAQRVLDDANATVVEQPVLRAPIRPRNNVMAVGKNYREHAKEFADSGFDASATQTIPDHPIVFTKALTSLVGPGDPITLSVDSTGTTDYEGELGVVIGAGGTKIQKADAWEHVYGYTVINDVTARQVQKRHVQFFIGKSGATFCPMGPAIVTRDEIPDIESTWLRTTVNGDERQAAQIKDLIFDIPTLIASISDAVLLEPGDVIATGTPAGVGLGFKPPRFLQPGDVVDITIDGIGTLSNPVVA